MELLCPLCQSKVTIDDKLAGQITNCPACNAMFQAPSLPDAPPPPPPQMELPPPTFPTTLPTQPTTMPPTGVTGAPLPEPEMQIPPPPPVPPSTDVYKHYFYITFNQRYLSYVPIGGLALILLISFFSWLYVPPQAIPVRITKSDATKSDAAKSDTAKSDPAEPKTPRLRNAQYLSMWGAAGESGLILTYVIFYFLTLPVAIVALLLDMKVFSLPDPLKKVRKWRSLIVAGMAATGFLFLFIQWALNLFDVANMIGFSMAFLVQLIVMVASLLDYWLQRRAKDELPVPRIEMRW